MARQLPIEIFMPPNILKAKVGSALGGIDTAALKRAEAAVETLKTEFHGWLATDVARLGECRDRLVRSPSEKARGELFRAAHDLKGEGETLEFPMISRLAASLTRLIDTANPAMEFPLGLVDAHVAAIRVVFRDKVRSMADKTAAALAEELEARVGEALGEG
ncbi:MAG TPA: Hpt domain-containing protein [Rhizomicrobium sp.]